MPSISEKAVDAAKVELSSWRAVREVMYQPDAAVDWSVAVFDDGSKRDGLAQSVCMTLAEHSASDADSIVRIVDMAKVLRGQPASKWTSLGSAYCADGEAFD